MKFFIKANLSRANSMSVAEDVVNLLKEENHEFKFCQEDGVERLSDKIVTLEDGAEWCDVVITIGGDGTLLSACKVASDNNKPIFGINTGHMGFLTTIEADEIFKLKNVEDKNLFTLQKHHFLQTKINNSQWYYCINDVIISKSMYTNTVGLALSCHDKVLMEFLGDGIIIATSTGSTAYSLSAGGPIVDSDLQAMIVSPVAPHTLTRTSMVMNKDKHLKITANNINRAQAYIALDGVYHQAISANDEIFVRLSPKYVSIYSFGKLGQFEKVDKKLKSR